MKPFYERNCIIKKIFSWKKEFPMKKIFNEGKHFMEERISKEAVIEKILLGEII